LDLPERKPAIGPGRFLPALLAMPPGIGPMVFLDGIVVGVTPLQALQVAGFVMLVGVMPALILGLPAQMLLERRGLRRWSASPVTGLLAGFAIVLISVGWFSGGMDLWRLLSAIALGAALAFLGRAASRP
jgi:hypothetical protein